MFRTSLLSCIIVVAITGCAAPPDRQAADPTPAEIATELGAWAIEGPAIGSYGRTVTGAGPEAQKWFNQGIRCLYGFNQDAAGACFARAALASPDCPMAWWGIAHVFSVDINNADVSEQEGVWAMVAAREAARLIDHASPVERGLIEAARTRAVTPVPGAKDRKHLDVAYCKAMEKLRVSASADVDVVVLFAESLMLLQPWSYWTVDGDPVERALEIVSTLEEALAMTPDHPGANHFYIHAVESSSDPARGVPSADRLGKLMPGSGHLVHMPSHIYIHVGRYGDAARVNIQASELDATYFEKFKRPTFYRVYFLHNLHFATYASMMEGHKGRALRYVQRMEEEADTPMIRSFIKVFDASLATRMHVYVRFGMWDEILATPDYPEYRKASRAMRRYARTVALANLGRTKSARGELARFDEAAAATPDDWSLNFNPPGVVYGLARQVAEAEILWREGKPKEAIALLEKAAAVERTLVYTEPPAWMIPVRHATGAIQLASGDALGAEATYRADLASNRENPWGLLGLHQALEKLGKQAEAAALKPRVDLAWTRADIDPPASCYCGVVTGEGR